MGYHREARYRRMHTLRSCNVLISYSNTHIAVCGKYSTSRSCELFGLLKRRRRRLGRKCLGGSGFGHKISAARRLWGPVHFRIFNFLIQITPYKADTTERKELQVNHPLECCAIVIWWKAFFSEGVPEGCRARKKA